MMTILPRITFVVRAFRAVQQGPHRVVLTLTMSLRTRAIEQQQHHHNIDAP